MPTKTLEPRRFADLPGWAEADHDAAFAAFVRSAERFLAGAVKTGSLGVEADVFRVAAEAALRHPIDPGSFFETYFSPAYVRPDPGANGFVTGYYEPVVGASSVRTDRHRVPLHRPPPDLVKVGPERPADLDPDYAFARRLADGRVAEYFDRAAIARGALDGQGLEIAWLEDPVDAFFIHVQGSARLELEDGRRIRVTYAGKTGHRFTAIGRILVSEGELVLEKADMAGIRRWLADHPERVQDLLDRNRSYIFFNEVPVPDEALGPVAAAGVPITALASLAVDRLIHTFGTPIFLDAPLLTVADAPFRRLLIAQDTGSAIVGTTRGDIFVGSGDAAGAVAGAIRHPADFYALLPKGQAPE